MGLTPTKPPDGLQSHFPVAHGPMAPILSFISSWIERILPHLDLLSSFHTQIIISNNATSSTSLFNKWITCISSERKRRKENIFLSSRPTNLLWIAFIPSDFFIFLNFLLKRHRNLIKTEQNQLSRRYVLSSNTDCVQYNYRNPFSLELTNCWYYFMCVMNEQWKMTRTTRQ